MIGAWLPPKRIGRPLARPPVGKIEPGVAFVANLGRFDVVDRATGELLGIIWRASDCTWSVAAPDDSLMATGLRGNRHDIGAWLQHQNGVAS
jgi:hypothetical protein